MNESSLRILVVDDSPLQQQYLQALLAGRGFSFLVAGNGAAAVDSARRERPDIILMDIEMPVLDGLAAAQQVRADPTTAGIPIIMVTGHADADAMESAFVGGCNDYVTKPVHQAELLAKIAALTGYAPGAPA